jgi:predicted dehydrogenase
MARGRIRLGVIGAGRNAVAKHLPAFASIPEVEIVAVANRTERSATRVADLFGVGRVFSDWRSLLHAGITDAILVGTWPDLHGQVTVEALESGNHVLTEGRMAASLMEAKQMRDVAREHPDLVLQIVPTSVGLEADDTMRRIVSEELGRLIAVEGHFHEGGFPDRERQIHWRERSDSSGIHIMSLGRRYETLCRWIPPVTRVAAVGRTFVDVRPAEEGTRRVDVPDLLVVTGQTSESTIVTLNISSVTGLAPPPTFRLYGESATVELGEGPVVRFGRRGAPSLEPIAHEGDGWRVEHDFVASILDGSPVGRCTVSEAMEYMMFADAVQRSLQSGGEPVGVASDGESGR